MRSRVVFPPGADATDRPGACAMRFFLPFLVFTHPEPVHPRIRLRPFFLPWQGCPARCLFCDQAAQTGLPSAASPPGAASDPQSEKGLEDSIGSPTGFPIAASTGSPEQEADRLRHMLESARREGGGPCELGFFGGSFALLPAARRARLLEIAAEYKRLGVVGRVRCSTRPDGVTAASLSELRRQGLDLIEFGVQTFDDDALTVSGRGYSSGQAERACRLARSAGLALGVQLLPGLPGTSRKNAFGYDIMRAISLKPEVIRIYPCLVLAGAPLADLWRAGLYRPWSLERTVPELALAVLACWRAGVRVIRLGLPPEPAMLRSLLAGPWAPDLGFRARSLALFLDIRTRLARLGAPPRRLRLPRRHASEFLGHKRERLPAWERLGLPWERVRVWEGSRFMLEW